MNFATTLTVVASVVLVGVTLLNAWAANRNNRRLASGTVSTSQADVLWKVGQDLLNTALAENAKLVEQRDKLVAGFERIIPLLEGVVVTQKRDGEMQARVLSLLEGGDSHEPAAPPVAPG